MDSSAAERALLPSANLRFEAAAKMYNNGGAK